MTLAIRRIVITAAVAALVALAAIGAARATTISPAPAAPAVLAAAPVALEASAGDLDTGNLDTADLDALLAADQTAAKPRAAAGIRADLRRLAAVRRLVHATVVVDLKQGGLTTIQLDHGTISTVGATTLTIAETGGGSVTVTLGSETRVRRNGAKAAIADLKTADEVFVMSKVAAGGTTAYLVVVPRN